MTGVTVVVPWRGGCPHREAAWEFVRGWWGRTYPGIPVVSTADTDTGGPWCKAAAVAAALPDADAGLIVVADADLICPGIGPAIAAVESGYARWAVPHYGVYRLTETATAAVLAGGEFPDIRGPRSTLRGQVAEVHRGVVGGGLVVLKGETWRECPIDARFTGWGQEDLAWGWALTRMFGAPFRGPEPLIHLWHPPQPRQTRVAGSTDSMRLWGRYRRAYTGAEVAELLAEPGARLP